MSLLDVLFKINKITIALQPYSVVFGDALTLKGGTLTSLPKKRSTKQSLMNAVDAKTLTSANDENEDVT